jgi:hypothetical protein
VGRVMRIGRERSEQQKGRGPRSAQLELPFLRLEKGKKRAGRRRAAGRGFVRHRRRAVHRAAEPVHVVLRSRFRPLRSRYVFPTVRLALARATRARPGFRVVQFSVQSDHLHLIVEARDKLALSRGMRGSPFASRSR